MRMKTKGKNNVFKLMFIFFLQINYNKQKTMVRKRPYPDDDYKPRQRTRKRKPITIEPEPEPEQPEETKTNRGQLFQERVANTGALVGETSKYGGIIGGILGCLSGAGVGVVAGGVPGAIGGCLTGGAQGAGIGMGVGAAAGAGIGAVGAATEQIAYNPKNPEEAKKWGDTSQVISGIAVAAYGVKEGSKRFTTTRARVPTITRRQSAPAAIRIQPGASSKTNPFLPPINTKITGRRSSTPKTSSTPKSSTTPKTPSTPELQARLARLRGEEYIPQPSRTLMKTMKIIGGSGRKGQQNVGMFDRIEAYFSGVDPVSKTISKIKTTPISDGQINIKYGKINTSMPKQKWKNFKTKATNFIRKTNNTISKSRTGKAASKLIDQKIKKRFGAYYELVKALALDSREAITDNITPFEEPGVVPHPPPYPPKTRISKNKIKLYYRDNPKWRPGTYEIKPLKKTLGWEFLDSILYTASRTPLPPEKPGEWIPEPPDNPPIAKTVQNAIKLKTRKWKMGGKYDKKTLTNPFAMEDIVPFKEKVVKPPPPTTPGPEIEMTDINPTTTKETKPPSPTTKETKPPSPTTKKTKPPSPTTKKTKPPSPTQKGPEIEMTDFQQPKGKKEINMVGQDMEMSDVTPNNTKKMKGFGTILEDSILPTANADIPQPVKVTKSATPTISNSKTRVTKTETKITEKSEKAKGKEVIRIDTTKPKKTTPTPTQSATPTTSKSRTSSTSTSSTPTPTPTKSTSRMDIDEITFQPSPTTKRTVSPIESKQKVSWTDNSLDRNTTPRKTTNTKTTKEMEAEFTAMNTQLTKFKIEQAIKNVKAMLKRKNTSRKMLQKEFDEITEYTKKTTGKDKTKYTKQRKDLEGQREIYFNEFNRKQDEWFKGDKTEPRDNKPRITLPKKATHSEPPGGWKAEVNKLTTKKQFMKMIHGLEDKVYTKDAARKLNEAVNARLKQLLADKKLTIHEYATIDDQLIAYLMTQEPSQYTNMRQ